MRILIVLIFILMISFPVNAVDQSDMDFCKSLSTFAGVVMIVRQSGLSMSRVMEIAAKPASEGDTTKELLQNIVIEAYSKPRYSTEENQLEIIETFRDYIYLECIKSLSVLGK